MAVFSWNARGLGEYDKIIFLHDVICKFRISFLGIQETKKVSLSDALLNSISGSFNFVWTWVPSQGQSGLLGVNTDVFEVLSSEIGRFYALFCVKERSSGFVCNIVTVYGAPHAKDKVAFLVELVHIFSSSNVPLLVGGDFNLIRRSNESSKQRRISKWSRLFNAIIENWNMKDIEIPGRRFT